MGKEDAGQVAEPTEDELQKALDILAEAAQTPEDEKETLLQKALDGTIDEAENARLVELMGGGAEDTPALAKSVTTPLQPEVNEKLKKSLDVSDYLDGLYQGITDGMSQLADVIEKSDHRQHNFNVVLAKGVRAIGELMKSLDERLETVENQPVGGPRALKSQQQAAAHLKKSFAGQGGAADTLSKSEVMDTLESMHIESIEKGNGGMALCGEDLNKSITKYESTRRLSRPMFEELKTWRANKQAA